MAYLPGQPSADDDPKPLVFGPSSIKHEKQSTHAMESLLEEKHDEIMRDGRNFYFLTGDQSTRGKMPSLDLESDSRSWIPGPLHVNNNLTRLANGVAAETLGQGILRAFGRVTPKSQKPIVNATNTHQATEFLRFLAQAADRERARQYLLDASRLSCCCNNCRADLEVVAEEIRSDPRRWGEGLKKAIPAHLHAAHGRAPVAGSPSQGSSSSSCSGGGGCSQQRADVEMRVAAPGPALASSQPSTAQLALEAQTLADQALARHLSNGAAATAAASAVAQPVHAEPPQQQDVAQPGQPEVAPRVQLRRLRVSAFAVHALISQ